MDMPRQRSFPGHLLTMGSSQQDRGMSGLDWSHNAYYHRLLLRYLPRPCDRVLDVGCGAGALAVTLAGRAGHVDALDRSPVMIDAARRAVPGNVTCILGDVMRDPLPAARVRRLAFWRYLLVWQRPAARPPRAAGRSAS
jgi:ubiquinone/menaquinone biosynthesis C-methylase UbiE